jgi:molybdate transport system permease protein
MPFLVTSLEGAIRSQGAKFENAAAALGASRTRTFFQVSLPIMLPAFISATALAFSRALGEFGATITFVANIPGRTQTLPSAIYAFLQVPGADMQAARLAAISVAVAVGALVVSEVVARRVARRIGGA